MEHINRVLNKVKLSANSEKKICPALEDVFKQLQVIESCSKGSTKGCGLGCVGS